MRYHGDCYGSAVCGSVLRKRYDKSRNTDTNILIQRTQCQAVGPKNKAQDLLHIRKKIQSLGGEQK